jgi:type II secretory pathway pseudopilin PulG
MGMRRRHIEARNNHAVAGPPVCLADKDNCLVQLTPLYRRLRIHPGFALLELLVVISILMILLSVMMPALHKARQMARLTICKTNMHQMNLSLVAYAADHDGRIVPGDLWNGTTIYVGSAWDCSGPGNFGYLLAGGYLPLPTSPSHVFYCPADKTERFYTKGVSNNSQRSFENRWGTRLAAIDFGYEFRDSLDGGICYDSFNYIKSMKANHGARYEKIASHAILSDCLAWGTVNSHNYLYNVSFGDMSVRMINDRSFRKKLVSTDPKQTGFTNWIFRNYCSNYQVENDDLAFDVIDYLFDCSLWQVPRIPGDRRQLYGRWRLP